MGKSLPRRVRAHRPAWWLPPLFAVTLSGCTSVAAFRGLPVGAEASYLANVPPLTQDARYSCGAVCLASVAAALEVPLDSFRARFPAVPQDLSAAELVLMAATLDLVAVAYAGSMDDLDRQIALGRPLVVMIPQPLAPGFDPASRLVVGVWNQWTARPSHWVVVLGSDRDGRILVHDPASGPLALHRDVFARWWRSRGFVTVLIARPPAPAGS